MAISDLTSLQNPHIIWGVPPLPPLPPSAALSQWQLMRANYVNWWNWYSGVVLTEEDPEVKGPDPAYLYPLRINPIRMIAQRHATALFGEVGEDAESNYEIYFRNADKRSDMDCKAAAKIVNTVLAESNARLAQDSNAEISQFLGGCIFKIRYDPRMTDYTYHISLETVMPDSFIPVFEIGNPSKLLECHVFYYITPEEAKERFGSKIGPVDNLGKVLYYEHWTQTDFEIKVGGVIPMLTVGDATVEQKGKHGFGRVPYVYIPHNVRVGGFYGWSHVPGLSGLSIELNNRLADAGDYVRANSYSLYYDRNVTGGFKVRDLVDGIKTISVGTSFNGQQPEIIRLETPSVNNAHLELTAALWSYIEKESSTPSVAWGVDEGSQRSALTLAFRMWPLTSHVRRERSCWDAGNTEIARIIMAIAKAKGEAPVTDRMMKLRCHTRWAAMMPRDRLEEINEFILRKPAGLVSTRTAVEAMSTGGDLESELLEIKKDQEEAAALQVKVDAASKGATVPTASTRDAVDERM